MDKDTIGGVGLKEIARDAIRLHQQGIAADSSLFTLHSSLKNHGLFAWRKDGIKHAWNPETIAKLQLATRQGDYGKFKEWAAIVDEKESPIFIRDFFKFKKAEKATPIDEVEPVESIVKHFVTGAMSFGALSIEAHEALALAMNKLGARSNTGEGGEDNARYHSEVDGVSLSSKTKQIASGRFGVTAEYLVNAEEIQIKVAQGAKPGEGGQLPGFKVNEIIAKTRNAILRNQVRLQTDGQLKTAKDVIIMAMLGADEFSFGTLPLIVLGCVMMRKCNTNTCPMGVATQNPELRKHFEGRAEYVVNFFTFLAEQVREYLSEIGVHSLKEIIGHTELIEINEELRMKSEEFAAASEKWRTIDFARLLHKPETEKALYWDRGAFTKVTGVLDERIIKDAQKAIDNQEEVSLEYAIRNTDRAVTTMLSGVIAKKYGASREQSEARFDSAEAQPVLAEGKYGEAGLPDNTINIKFKGSAGQSFGAFAVKGVNLKLEGECNDYFGKGLSGGRISILPPARSGEDFHAEDNIIAGNTGLYGATSGELYINGKVGERFGVRNSGAIAVIEGAGDHCCEYMTGGRVVVLGKTGRNFAAGMSGGVAYVYDPDHTFDYFCNMDMVELSLVEDSVSRKELLELIRQHYLHTGSALAGRMLDDWQRYVVDFIQVVPIEYKRVLQEEQNKKLQEKIANIQRDY